MFKKSISPVVASALLLVVAVVAVVGFQNWYGIFSSKLLSDTEQKNNLLNNVDILLVEDNTLYLKSNSNSNISISAIKIGNNTCILGAINLTYGVNQIDLGFCPIGLEDQYEDIVIITQNGVFTEKQTLKNTDLDLYLGLTYISPSLNQIVTNGSNLTINVSSYYNLSSCRLHWNNGTEINYTMTTLNNYCYYTIITPQIGNYNFYVDSNINSSQLNFSESTILRAISVAPILIYTKTYDSGGFDEINSLFIDSSNNLFVGGYSWISNYDFTVIKYNSSGGQVFVNYYNYGSSSDSIFKLKLDGLGNIIAVGQVHNGTYQGGIYKLNSTGGVLWKNETGAGGVDAFTSFDIDNSNNIYLIFEDGNQVYDTLYKYNSSGAALFNITLVSNFYSDEVRFSPSGELYIAGTLNNNYSLYKYNPINGSLIWSNNYTVVRSFTLTDFEFDSIGNIYLTGQNGSLVSVIKLNSTGSMLWNTTYDYTGPEYESNLALSLDENSIYISNYIGSGINSFNILKLSSSNGSVSWARNVYSSSGRIKDIKIDSSGNIYLAGTDNGNDILLKYNSTVLG